MNYFVRRARGPAGAASVRAMIALAACGAAAFLTACGSGASSHGAVPARAPVTSVTARAASGPASATPAPGATGAGTAPTATSAPATAPASTPPTAHATSPAAAPSATAPATARGGPLAGKSADAIIAAAVANTEAASTVRMAGAGTDAGKGVMFNLTLVRGQGCAGTLSMSNAQTFRLIYLGKTAWIRPSDAFYTGMGVNKAALALLAGKYIKVKSTDSLVANISNLCTLRGLLGTVGPTSGRSFAAVTTTYQGQPVIKLTQPGRAGYAYISDTARPMLLVVTEPGASGGSIAFTNYNATVTITPPPATQTIDGSQFGL